MVKVKQEVILAATLEVSMALPAGSKFRASSVRDHLRLPVNRWYNEQIRECWRQNESWLGKRGFRLIEVPKQKVSWWYLLKE